MRSRRVTYGVTGTHPTPAVPIVTTPQTKAQGHARTTSAISPASRPTRPPGIDTCSGAGDAERREIEPGVDAVPDATTEAPSQHHPEFPSPEGNNGDVALGKP